MLLILGACDGATPHRPESASGSPAPASTPSAFGPPAPAPTFALQAKTLDCGNYFGCSIAAGKLACWGYNQFGQLGSGRLAYPARGRALVAVPSPVGITIGLTHACALTGEGAVYCWGTSSGGALGDGVLNPPDAPTSRIVRPTKVEGLGARAVDLDAGSAHTCVVLEDGAAACWGENHSGVLGTEASSTAKPVRIAGVAGAVEIATSDALTCVRSAIGEVSCWGRKVTVPQRLEGLCARQLAVASGGACALECTGAVSCWGSLPGFGGAAPSPKPKEGFRDVAEIRGGLAHFVARDRAGRVVTWGGNDSGQLGNGKPSDWTSAEPDSPVVLETPWKAQAVCANGIVARPDGKAYLRPATFVDTGTSCARSTEGEVYCWGEPDLDYVPKRVELPR